jgi:hypothetical protein
MPEDVSLEYYFPVYFAQIWQVIRQQVVFKLQTGSSLVARFVPTYKLKPEQQLKNGSWLAKLQARDKTAVETNNMADWNTIFIRGGIAPQKR